MAIRLILLLALISASVFPAFAHAKTQVGCLKDLLMAATGPRHAAVVRNKFVIDRGFEEYFSIFGPRLKLILDRTLPGFRWLESGAGLANAPREFLAIPTANPLQIVGVSYVIPKGAFESPSFVHMGGRFLENIANDELGKFDLITDTSVRTPTPNRSISFCKNTSTSST